MVSMNIKATFCREGRLLQPSMLHLRGNTRRFLKQVVIVFCLANMASPTSLKSSLGSLKSRTSFLLFSPHVNTSSSLVVQPETLLPPGENTAYTNTGAVFCTIWLVPLGLPSKDCVVLTQLNLCVD